MEKVFTNELLSIIFVPKIQNVTISDEKQKDIRHTKHTLGRSKC